MKRFSLKTVLIALIIGVILFVVCKKKEQEGYPNRIVATVPVGNRPCDAAALPNSEYVYVTNGGSNNVSVIRTSDNTVAATIPVGDSPDGIVALPNGNYVYAVNRGGNSISVIKTSNNTVETTIPLNTGPMNIAVLPNGFHFNIQYWIFNIQYFLRGPLNGGIHQFTKVFVIFMLN